LQLIDAARNLKTRSQFKGNLIALSMQFQYYAGLRVSELIRVTPKDIRIDFDRVEVFVRRGKGNKQRIVPIVDKELIATLRFLNSDGIDLDAPYINKSRKTIWRWYKKAAVSTGLYVTTHIFRHSFARNLLLKGVPINHVSLLLGHSYLSTTVETYLQLTPSHKEIDKAWELLNKDMED
jgi:integrase/recombinase XerD|tara:strand:- start:369 stop:905 length:537 start_codon:yes stop_codon:yes gene_type:complete